MNLLLNILLVVVLCIMAFEDFKSRSINCYWIPVMTVLIYFIRCNDLGNYLKPFVYSGINLLIISLIAVLLQVVFSIRKRRFVNLFRDYIGSGDTLVIVGLGLAFTPENFIFFLNASLVITLIVHMLVNFLIKRQNRLIPLVSYLSLCYAVHLSLMYFLPVYASVIDGESGLLTLITA